MATAKKIASRKTAPAVAVAQVGEASLEQIVEATQAGSFVYTSASVHVPLIEAGLAEINPAMHNEAGELATRATQKGIETVSSTTTQETAAVETAAAAPIAASTGFVVEAGIPMPSISGRGRTGTLTRSIRWNRGIRSSCRTAKTSRTPLNPWLLPCLRLPHVTPCPPPMSSSPSVPSSRAPASASQKPPAPRW